MSYEGTLRGREYIKGSYKDMKSTPPQREFDKPAKQQIIAARPVGSGGTSRARTGGFQTRASISASQHFSPCSAEC